MSIIMAAPTLASLRPARPSLSDRSPVASVTLWLRLVQCMTLTFFIIATVAVDATPLQQQPQQQGGERDRTQHRIVAIGDLHGDYENAIELFRQAQVVDQNLHWATGADTVVQMGDVVDRGPHGHSIMDWFAQLKREARAAGGEFITLLGNHELMNLMSDLRFVDHGMIDAFGGLPNWKHHFTDGSQLWGKYMTQLTLAAVRNGTVFVHGGLAAKFLAGGKTVEALANEMRHVLESKAWTDPLVGIEGPVWNREIIHRAQAGDCAPLQKTLRAVSDSALRSGHSDGVTRMVVGHTIQPDGLMRSYCNGSLLAIDICISQYMGPTCGYLGHLELLPGAPPSEHPQQHAQHHTSSAFFMYPPKRNAKHELHPASAVPVAWEVRSQDIKRKVREVIVQKGGRVAHSWWLLAVGVFLMVFLCRKRLKRAALLWRSRAKKSDAFGV